MKYSIKRILALIVALLGVILMISGAVTGKHGATVVGIIISGVATQQYIALKSKFGNTVAK